MGKNNNWSAYGTSVIGWRNKVNGWLVRLVKRMVEDVTHAIIFNNEQRDLLRL